MNLFLPVFGGCLRFGRWFWWCAGCRILLVAGGFFFGGLSFAATTGLGGAQELDVELPALDVFAGFFAGDDDDELRDFAADHPFVELGHDLFDVGFDLVVGGNWGGGGG